MRENIQDTRQHNTCDSEHTGTGMWGSRDDKPHKIITTPRTPGPSSHQKMRHKGHQMCKQKGHQPHETLGTAAPMTPGSWELEPSPLGWGLLQLHPVVAAGPHGASHLLHVGGVQPAPRPWTLAP